MRFAKISFPAAWLLFVLLVVEEMGKLGCNIVVITVHKLRIQQVGTPRKNKTLCCCCIQVPMVFIAFLEPILLLTKERNTRQRNIKSFAFLPLDNCMLCSELLTQNATFSLEQNPYCTSFDFSCMSWSHVHSP